MVLSRDMDVEVMLGMNYSMLFILFKFSMIVGNVFDEKLKSLILFFIPHHHS